MKLLKRLMHGYHLARYLLILCAIGYLWWEGESVWGAGVLAILMVGIPLWKLLQRTTRTRQTVDVISGGIRVESAAGVSEEISAWEVGGLRVIRSGLLIYGQDGKRLGAVAWRTGTVQTPAMMHSGHWRGQGFRQSRYGFGSMPENAGGQRSLPY